MLKRFGVSLLAALSLFTVATAPAMASEDSKGGRGASYAQPSHVKQIMQDGDRKKATGKNPVSRALLLTCPPDCYWYGSDQATVASSTSANGNFTSWKPTLGTDTHSLAELAVADSTQSQIVEVGWTVDAGVCGSIANSPCLFVYHWVNGASTCYNGCGWVDNGAVALNAGSTLAVSGGTAATLKTYKFGIQHSATTCGASSAGWWITAWLSTGTSQNIGCFPDSLWTSPTFTSFTRILGFGEIVSSSSTTPTANMGSGLCGTVANVNTTGFIGSLQTNLGLITASGAWTATDSTKYSVSGLSGASGYYGGDTTCP